MAALPSTNRPEARWIVAGLLPLFVIPVWAAGGTYRAWQGVFSGISLFAWVCYFYQPRLDGLPSRKDRLVNLLRDPVLWSALLFLGFLVWQWRNTGRIQIFDFQRQEYTYTPPKYPGPWSINRIEALEMIKWFTPLLTCLLILRHTWTRISTRTLLWGIGINGLLNAILAFTHQVMGWEKMYNLQRFGNDVYGSFGYPNHGAVYFILLFSIALGLALRETGREASDRDRPTWILAAVWAPVFFLAANLSTSRAGILGAWLVLIFSGATLLMVAWPRAHPVQRLQALIGGGCLVAFLSGAFVLFAKPIHVRELKHATLSLDVSREVAARFFQVETAWHMWRDHPWFGVGGWGYRYFVSRYLPVEQWTLLAGKGKANVHNDWMQFLAEFGLVGFGLLVLCFLPRIRLICRGVFLRPTRDASVWSDPLKICVFWGVVMLLLDSQIDIPLRSPAVFMHGVLLLFLLGPHPDSPSIWPPVVDWSRLTPPPFGVKGRKREIIPE